MISQKKNLDNFGSLKFEIQIFDHQIQNKNGNFTNFKRIV